MDEHKNVETSGFHAEFAASVFQSTRMAEVWPRLNSHGCNIFCTIRRASQNQPSIDSYDATDHLTLQRSTGWLQCIDTSSTTVVIVRRPIHDTPRRYLATTDHPLYTIHTTYFASMWHDVPPPLEKAKAAAHRRAIK
jgi:hypothetical protein